MLLAGGVMSSSNARRLVLCGLVFILLDLMALFLPGPPPKASDSAGHIASTLAAHRLPLMAGMYVGGLAIVALVFFLGGLRAWLHETGAEPGVSFAAGAGALLAIAAQLVGLVLFYGATFKVAGQHQDGLV